MTPSANSEKRHESNGDGGVVDIARLSTRDDGGDLGIARPSARDEKDLSRRDGVACNSGGPMAWTTRVTVAADDFCNIYDGQLLNLDLEREYDCGTLGVHIVEAHGIWSPSDYGTICHDAFGSLNHDCNGGSGLTNGGVATLYEFAFYLNPKANPDKRDGSTALFPNDAASLKLSERAAEDTDDRPLIPGTAYCNSGGPLANYWDPWCTCSSFCLENDKKLIGDGISKAYDFGTLGVMRPSVELGGDWTVDEADCGEIYFDLLQDCNQHEYREAGGVYAVQGKNIAYYFNPSPTAPKETKWNSGCHLKKSDAPPALAARQEDVSCTSGPSADSTELKAAGTAFCKHFKALDTWPNESQTFDYGLVDGTNATLTRSSTCSEPQFDDEQACVDDFGDIIEICGGATVSSEGTKVTVRCITYAIEIGAAYRGGSASASCSSGPRAPVTDLQQAAASLCDYPYNEGIWPHQEQAVDYPVANGDTARIRRHSECAQPQQEPIENCKMYFDWIIDTYETNDSDSSSGGSLDTGLGCLTYAIEIISAPAPPVLARRMEPTSTVICFKGEPASSVAIQNATDHFCGSLNGFEVPQNSTLSEQLPLPLEQGKDMTLEVNVTVLENGRFYVMNPSACKANFENIMADCDDGNTETAGGEYVVDGSLSFTLQMLPASSGGI